uniref:Ribosomal RNA small subunit methyltransferase G n=1 Tax=Magnetococcus massalia (strain MO-1) TaxID=451514 RepID=A0A1S7LKX7_MAGMO|nr:putative Ribosomal RNA small subunit methyltransferase G (rsmG/gidB) [Candidatus Magnetococcus massalia]
MLVQIKKALQDVGYGGDLDRCSSDLAWYLSELILWNRKINLIGRSTEEEVLTRHLVESALYYSYTRGKKVVCDIGTGAGLPGIVLAIMMSGCEDSFFYLIDKDHKKCNFMRHVSSQLKLKNIEIIENRVEEDKRLNSGIASIVISRALADLCTLTDLSEPLLANGGGMVFMKGPAAEEELESLCSVKKKYIGKSCVDSYVKVGGREIKMVRLSPESL